MKLQILQEIKDAEAEVQRMIDDAQVQKQQIIEDAKRKSLKIIDEAKKEAKKIGDEMNASADAEIAQIRRDILNNGDKEIFEIKKRANSKEDEALSYIIEEFKRVSHA